ncbi:hypothetical protein [Tessaracoccus sp. G1721]
MPDDQPRRPRRAWQPDEDTSSPTVMDDTSGDDIFRPRRGSAADPAAFALGDEPAAPLGETPIPAPVFPHSAGEYADSPSPAPRRSALSSLTPVGAEEYIPAARPQALRPGLARWIVGGVVGALVVGLIAFAVSRGGQPTDPASPSPNVTASASGSATAVPAATVDDLLTGEDLAGVAPAASWAVTSTTTEASEHEGRVACLSTEDAEQNPTASLQRTLATSDEDQLAALHRIETYASPAAAQQVVANRTAALSSCDEIPARIVRSTAVEGLGDESFQISVVFEDIPAQFHTLLLTRVGSSVQILDLTRASGPLEAELVAASLARPQAALCTVEGATCAETVTTTPAVVPPVEPYGWLIPSDLARVRGGAGRWTASEPTDLTSGGMGCENMTLASEPGPTERQQATYLLTQDDQAPSTFGLDSLRFVFADAAAATAFSTKLGNAIATCKDRVNTATVAELPAVAGTGEGGVATSTRIFSVTQATADNAAIPYQLLVSTAGTRVAYTIVTVTDAFKYTDAQLAELAARIPVRASQG